jgi:hypothetical protein
MRVNLKMTRHNSYSGTVPHFAASYFRSDVAHAGTFHQKSGSGPFAADANRLTSRPLLGDFVAEVGDDKSVAAGANFLS